MDAAFAELKTYWEKKTSVFQCHTPHPGLDTMINTWNLYQAETCVVWSRFASFIEVGGRTGLGFRDTAQDVMGVVHSNPIKSRERIIQLLRGHTRIGYGLHLFDPDVFEPPENRLPWVKLPTVFPTPKPSEIVHGLEDACSDDALWLVASICEWVVETGDYDFLGQVIPYADSGDGTVYEHLTRILDFSAKYIGHHGICLGLRADWNDCLNLGGGESAMVSFMHHWVINVFIGIAKYLGRQADIEKYNQIAEQIRKACEEHLWDGEWYIRGFTKKGIKIGSHESEEGKIFLNAQTWAVLSGVASPERARQCMDAVNQYLYCQFGLHLLWPSYSKPNDDIGYVTRVYKGVKENGAIFSHTNPWAIIAECLLGRAERAMKFYNAMLPYNQNDLIETRQAEPYSYCQFIMGRDHQAHGRARHPWLTGSAGWFYTAVTKYILGIRPTCWGLVIDPCIPSDWKRLKVIRKWRGATYFINITNLHGVQKGAKVVKLNGEPARCPIPIQAPGSECLIEVEIG